MQIIQNFLSFTPNANSDFATSFTLKVALCNFYFVLKVVYCYIISCNLIIESDG